MQYLYIHYACLLTAEDEAVSEQHFRIYIHMGHFRLLRPLTKAAQKQLFAAHKGVNVVFLLLQVPGVRTHLNQQ